MMQDNHIFQGMKRDNHPIRQDAQFLWDAHNIRLTNREDNTLFSITNEKGTSSPLLTFKNYYVGHCVLGKYLVVFTATEDDGYSYIYRVEKTGDTYTSTILYQGYIMLSPHNPIEAIGIYENEFVQKVYWIDSINQPRVINIVKDNPNYHETSFDFVQTLKLEEIVNISKMYGQGEFSSGTIQYAFSYFNKYGQESNIFYITPLHYVALKDRGGSPEEKVSCSFDIQLVNTDRHFDYIRIYSIHRTSINATPTVKLVSDIKNHEGIITYLDSGDTGSIVDPTILLYIGGKSIIPEAIAHKDGTLFLGNYKIENDENFDDIKNIIQSDYELDDYQIPTNQGSIDSETYYNYIPALSYPNTAGFKCGETYRYGVQVQYSNGEWSEPIFIGDSPLCTMYPWETYPYRDSKAVKIMGASLGSELRRNKVRRIRTCIVFPSAPKTEIICQGLLCPTVRKADSEWNFNSSWIFRPSVSTIDNYSDVYKGSNVEFRHNQPLKTGADRGAEIQGMIAPVADNGGNGYVVDENVVTFHSPDLEFNNSIRFMDLSNTELSIVGIAKLGAISGDIDIQTDTPGISKLDGNGFIKQAIGYYTGSNLPINGGLISGLFYRDTQVTKDNNGNYNAGDSLTNWLIYLWHRSGSLNNDENRATDRGIRTSVLLNKKISNLKFFSENLSLDTSLYYNISTPQLFSSDELSLIKLQPAYLGQDISYLGNVDTLITNSSYNIYQGSEFNDTLVPTEGTDVITNSAEPVRIKYKSSPHLVFSLGNDKTTIELLPRHVLSGGAQNESFTFPAWMQPEVPSSKDTFDGILYLYTTDYISNRAADASLLGKYTIGKKANGSYGLFQCTSGREGRGRLSWKDAHIPFEGIILKADNTIIYPSTNYLPETSSDNYTTRGNSTRLSIVKYYKVTGDSAHNILSISDVTDENKEDPSSDKYTYTLNRQGFNNSIGNLNECPYLLIGELVRRVDNKFGEDGESETENIWFPAGNPVNVYEDSKEIIVPFQYGDTWYSRYDCLKTYPFTKEDENQLVEIGSFMCETRVNIDGRYDKNRGQLSNLNMTPQNFNHVNEVYTQKDNFFNYRTLDKDYYKQNKFGNQITWSKQKNLGEEIDNWTNITLANTLDLDGSKGNVTALRTYNDNLIGFQDKAISQILFNSRVQIPVTDGVPIEISNGYKVDGSRIINDVIGCSNKWSIINTTSGLYFLDSNTDNIYLFNGQLTNLSSTKGVEWWVKQNSTDNIWKATEYATGELNGIRSFYDNKYGDIYFTPGSVYGINQPEALYYSEKLGQFISLMSYGGTQAMFNFADNFYSLRNNNGEVRLYQNNAGDYNNFYGEIKDWSISFISNHNPTITKVFDNIELKADCYIPNNNRDDNFGLLGTDLTHINQSGKPLNFIKVENEYQDTKDVVLNDINMRKKFRLWRILIPRNNNSRERIRNPWARITLGMKNPNNKLTIIHDLNVGYTI